MRSGALLVDDRGAVLLVLGLGDPHLMERAERGENAAADPGAEAALGGGRGDELELVGGGEVGGQVGL